MKATSVVTDEPIRLSPRSRFRAAMILAMAADALHLLMTCWISQSQPCWSPARLALGISASIRCRTRARSRFGSFLDAGGHQHLSQVEADHDHHSRNSGAAPGAAKATR